MIELGLGEIAEAVQGTLVPAEDGARVVDGLVIDSRQVRPGVLFAALAGERTDGHDHAADAIAAGAAAVLALRPVAQPAVVVADVEAAMAALARYALRRTPGARVVALTGSSGKTSTKDLIAGLLEPAGPTISPPGSY